MTVAQDDPQPQTASDAARSPLWLKRLIERLFSDRSINAAVQSGKFDFSIESIIRIGLDIDASASAEINDRNLHLSLTRIAELDGAPDLKSWALVVIAYAVLNQEGAYRLDLHQHEAGRAKPQKSGQLAGMIEKLAIVKSAEKAKADRVRSKNKVVAREHNLSVSTVQRAKTDKARLQKMRDETAG